MDPWGPVEDGNMPMLGDAGRVGELASEPVAGGGVCRLSVARMTEENETRKSNV